MLTDQMYEQLRMTDECQSPCPMPPMVHGNWQCFRGWNEYAASFPLFSTEYQRQALDYLLSVFPGLHVLSSFKQMYAWGMVALERLWRESAGG